jgi:G3E family GTPase
MKNEIPVLLLTGYLGSGKTTLLNRILSNKRGIKFAVIVNDIGEVNIDADLIEKGGIVNEQDDSLVALQNGCICCTLKMDLVKQLEDIIQMNRFDYIVIEASGICEPGPIAQTICSIPQMVPDMECQPRLDAIVTVVDALRMKDEFGSGLNLTRPDIDEEDIENLVIQQIEFCNIILLNKADEVSPDELGRIRQIIRTLQPKAEIIDTNYGDVELNKIINTCMFDFDDVATSATWIQEVERHDEDEDEDDDDDDDDEDHHHEEHEQEHHHEHHHHHHHHDDEGEAEEYGIGTYVYYARRPFNIGLFDEFVARKWPKGIIRAKGICWFKDEPEICYVFEQAGKQVSLRNAGQWYATMPKDELQQLLEQQPSLRRDWDEQYGDRMQKLVFIGQHLDKELIANELDFCLA